MSKFISCGKWNINYNYILLTGIFAFFTNFIFGYTYNEYLDEIRIYPKYNESTYDSSNYNNGNNHIIINYIFRYLGLILFSFVLYTFCYRNASKINTEDNFFKLSSIRLIYNNSEENTKNKIIISPKFILLIMIIMVVQEISEDIFYKSNLRALDFWMLELPLLSYLNLKYFKFKIYGHHKLVIYLNLIICSIHQIITLIILIKEGAKNSVFEYYNENLRVIPLGILTYIIIMTSRAFALSEIKVLMQYKYISPIKLLMLYGIIGAIISAIIGVISSFIECNYSLGLKICKIKDNTDKFYFENYKIWWEDKTKILGALSLLLLLFGIIMNFLYRLFYFYIIKN